MSIVSNIIGGIAGLSTAADGISKLINGQQPAGTEPTPGITLSGITGSADFIVFHDFEVPEEAPFGGEQAAAKHNLIGGKRRIDAMGRDDCDIAWSGTFLTPDADIRARQVDQYRAAGKPMDLVWGEHRYVVLIKSFLPRFRRPSHVPYSISFIVIEDRTKAVQASAPSLDQQVNTDLNSSFSLTSILSDAGAAVTAVMPYLNTVQATISSVTSVTGLSNPQLRSIQTSLSGAQSVIAPLTNGANGALGSLTTLGGVVAGRSGGTNAIALQNASQAASQLPQLLQLGSTLTRLSRNIGSTPGS